MEEKKVIDKTRTNGEYFINDHCVLSILFKFEYHCHFSALHKLSIV